MSRLWRMWVGMARSNRQTALKILAEEGEMAPHTRAYLHETVRQCTRFLYEVSKDPRAADLPPWDVEEVGGVRYRFDRRGNFWREEG